MFVGPQIWASRYHLTTTSITLSFQETFHPPLTVQSYVVCNKMTNKHYHTVGTIIKSNIKNAERDKIDTLTHKCITAHFSGLVQALQ